MTRRNWKKAIILKSKGTIHLNISYIIYPSSIFPPVHRLAEATKTEALRMMDDAEASSRDEDHQSTGRVDKDHG